jgi:putative heme-binding domain-containing protein
LRELLAGDAKAAEAIELVLASALKTAGDANAAPEARAAAIRLLLPIGTFDQTRATLTRALASDQPPFVQQAALSALEKFSDAGVATLIVQTWPGLTPALRTTAANVVFARVDRIAAFLDAVEAGKIKAADVDRARLATLASGGDDPALRERVKKLLDSTRPSASRQQVYDVYRPVLSLNGDPLKGQRTFEKTCAGCHRLGGIGNEIGPNLAAMQARGAEAVLLNLIDPSREVNPQFVEYVVQTKSGRTTSGLLASETAGAVTLKRAGGESETVPRTEIKRMKSTGLSIMPEGLEKGLDEQAMADLIAYVLSTK